MSIAYIISAYKYPDQVIRLVRQLDSDASSFFIHVDKKCSDDLYRQLTIQLAGNSNVHFMRRHNCYWGDFGHVRATLKGIEAIFSENVEFDYAVLLTGQDYPIKSNRRIRETLRHGNQAIFIRSFALPSERWDDGMDRIENWHLRVGRLHFAFPKRSPSKYRLVNQFQSLAQRIIPIKRTFPAGFKPFGGSSYWCIPKDVLQYVQDFVRLNRAFVRFFRYVDVPDEIFFQTIVMNSPFRERVVNDNLRFIRWGPKDDHPAVLGCEDFDVLSSSPALFARKFDATIDSDVLDQIDRKLLAGSSQ